MVYSPFYSPFIPFLFCCKHQPVDQGSFLHDVEAINQLPASQSLSWSQNELILHQTWLDRPCQMTTSCMRSCNLRPRPWSARTRARGRNNTPQGGVFFTLPPACVVSAKQLFSFYCKSARAGRASTDQQAPPDDHELLVLVLMLTWPIAIITYITEERVRFLILFIRPSPKVRKWRVCVRVSRTERSGRGFPAPQRPIGRLGRGWNSWSMSQEDRSSREGATCCWAGLPIRTRSSSSRPTLTSVCTEPPSPLSAAAPTDASVPESAAAASVTTDRWEVRACKCLCWIT